MGACNSKEKVGNVEPPSTTAHPQPSRLKAPGELGSGDANPPSLPADSQKAEARLVDEPKPTKSKARKTPSTEGDFESVTPMGLKEHDIKDTSEARKAAEVSLSLSPPPPCVIAT
jgi:hypothetical protein